MELANAILDQTFAFDARQMLYSKLIKGPTTMPKVIGFQVNGIGNGHLTQAKCVYDVLVDHFDIPIVVVYGRDAIDSTLFSKSKIVFKRYMSTPEGVNSGLIYPLLVDFLSLKDTRAFETMYGVNTWINFLVGDLHNYRTKQLMIAPQYGSTNSKLLVAAYFTKKVGHVSCSGIMKDNIVTDHILPPLINAERITRDVDDKLILCYSVSGIDFPSTLRKISRKHKDFTFHYFKNYDPNVRFLKNVVLHPTSRDEFKAYQMRAAAVLCTSGNELIQECVYNGIPVASLPCSSLQEEQIENNEYYTNRGCSVPMHAELNVSELTSSDVSITQNEITDMMNGRDQQIVDIVNKC